jgi:hypothetical protein
MKSLIATRLWVTFLLGCGGSGSTGGGPTPNAQLNGSWHATLASAASGGSSTLDVFIVQKGATLSSDRIALGGTCSSVGTMNGSVSGDKVNVVITGNNGDTVSLTGTASGANSLSGSYTIKTSGCGVNDDTETLSATLIPLSPELFLDRRHPVDSIPPGNTTFTANLTEDNSGNSAP